MLTFYSNDFLNMFIDCNNNDKNHEMFELWFLSLSHSAKCAFGALNSIYITK